MADYQFICRVCFCLSAFVNSILVIGLPLVVLVNMLMCNESSFARVSNTTKIDVYECNLSIQVNDWYVNEMVPCVNMPLIGDTVFVEFNHFFRDKTCFNLITDPSQRSGNDYRFILTYIIFVVKISCLTTVLFLITLYQERKQKLAYCLSKKNDDLNEV